MATRKKHATNSRKRTAKKASNGNGNGKKRKSASKSNGRKKHARRTTRASLFGEEW